MVKVKRTIWGEIKKRYISGFNAIKYKNVVYDVEYRPSFRLADGIKLPANYIVVLIHLRKKDITYAAITCRGWLGMFGPFDSDSAIVLRCEGYINDIKLLPEEEYIAALSELYDSYEEKMKERRKEEG